MAIAPTYTIINKRAKNSPPVEIIKHEALQNVRVKNNKLWTVWLDKITINEQKQVRVYEIKKIISALM